MSIIQKIGFWLSLLFFGAFGCMSAQTSPRSCGTMNGYQERIIQDATFRANEEALRQLIRAYENRKEEAGPEGLRSSVVTIPVVVHVLYRTAAENISNAQIQSQLDVLNKDFRALNSDVGLTPGAFKPVVSDVRIQFVLAKRDANCASTTGITRTNTTVTSFGFNPGATTGPLRNPVKFNTSGGHDGWPSSQYLNVWVCNLSGGVLGYASFPADLKTRPAEDGVVIDYRAFGTSGTAVSPYILGRTATHEIGHWLDLRHIWGDDGNACTGTDYVADTPNAAGPNFGCPSFQHISCGNGPNGDMFMNYMDYTDDKCMYMFTHGQSNRMDAVLYTTRTSIASSQGGVPPTAAADLYMKDTGTDIGAEPNTISTAFWGSDDIWVRRKNDGITNQEHQNPVGGATNYVYVRIRNRGCRTSGSANLKLYWAKASAGLGWPAPWDNSITTPVVMGSPIGGKPTGAIKGGDFTILEFSWVAPKPSDYASFGADKAHFCLLARVETSNAAPYGMTSTETSSLYDNVKNNNNIVWKNITVASPGKGIAIGQLLLANFSGKSGRYRVVFEIPKDEPSILNQTMVRVDLSSPAVKVWQKGPKVKEGLNTDLVIEKNGAYLDGIPMRPGEALPISLIFGELPNAVNNRSIFNLNVSQYRIEDNGKLQFVGSENVVVKYKKS